jgi:hypothetical protein
MGMFSDYMRREGGIEGMAEAWAEGWAQGKLEAKAEALLDLSERRFGSLPEELRRRVFAADAATLDRWVDGLLDARDLEATFGP